VSRLRVLPALLALSATLAAAQPPSAVPPPLPAADDLMDQVLTRLPTEPVVLRGRLQTGRTVAATGTVQNLEMAVRVLPEGIETRYTLLDPFGTELEQMSVLRPPQGAPQYRYAAGSPLAPAAAPDLLARLGNSAMCWADLTLSFLWWRGGKTIGRQEARGQPCYVVDLPAPDPKASDYSRVRVWVDTRVTMVLQAEGYDRTGELLRRITIKSIRKLHDDWMVKDLEVRDFAAGTRTILRVLDVAVGDQPLGERETDAIEEETADP
jgi:hypothetical protein